jgi:hypothetical protein
MIPGFPAIPIVPLKRACREWLGNLRPATAFELERLGLLRITRLNGQSYLAADDVAALIEIARQSHESRPWQSGLRIAGSAKTRISINADTVHREK